MGMLEKLQVLADSAKYDASCASSGSNRHARGKVGKTSLGGVCHSWSSDGRCISLLKLLMTNICIYDCAYCANRRSNDIPRAAFTPQEICDLTMQFYRKNYIEGLFLSSGIIKSPDHTMELLIETVRLLRTESQFYGYVHLKLIPGASQELIDRAGRYADRVSVNIELPSGKSLSLLAPQKNLPAILTPMKQVKESIDTVKSEKKKKAKPPAFSPAGQSTQLIVGATPESDLTILSLSEWFYKMINLKRVYYSAYVPVNNEKNLPALINPPLLREHRLYQADWLLRYYNFNVQELLSESNPDLDPAFDPKTGWALRHIDQFPVEINTADYNTLLRIPGMGIRSAYKIMTLRRVRRIQFEDLKKLRVALKRSQYFMTINGKYYGDSPVDPAKIGARLVQPDSGQKTGGIQLGLFSEPAGEFASVVTGEL